MRWFTKRGRHRHPSGERATPRTDKARRVSEAASRHFGKPVAVKPEDVHLPSKMPRRQP